MDCNQDVVVIDGCAVPRSIFELVKASARETSNFQTIGVLYEIPRELRPPAGEPIEVTFDKMLSRSAENRARMKAGLGMTYIVGATYDWLKSRADVLHLAMILHINPRG
jgi:hypothetical protein